MIKTTALFVCFSGAVFWYFYMYNVHKWWVFTRHYRVRIWLSDMTAKACCYVDCIDWWYILINNNYKRASCAGLDLQKLQNTPLFSCTKKRRKDCVF
jgi:hypothetical protein